MPFTPDQVAEIQGIFESYVASKKKRIPELPQNTVFGEVSLLDRLLLWMNAPDKTVWTDLLTIKQILTTGGTGAIAPVITGSDAIIEVDSSEAGGDTIIRPELEGKTYLLRLEGRALKPGVEWQLLSGGFKMLGYLMPGVVTGGGGYVNGTYANVPLTGGSGTGAKATIKVVGGAVTSVVITNVGTGYVAADTLSASNTNLGGSGAGFSVVVDAAGPYELTAGQRFDAEIYELQQTSTGTPAALSSSFITGRLEVAANTVLNGVNHANKLISVRGGATKVVLTLPDIINTPEKAIFIIESQITNQFQTKIQTAAGQFIYMNNTSWNSLWLGKGEALWLFRNDDGWIVLNDSFGNYYKNIGKPYASYTAEDDENELICDGSDLAKDDYPRLWAKVQTIGSSLTSDSSEWDSNKGMYLDVDAATFRIPDLRKMFLRGADTETPGTFQDESVNISTGVRGVKNTGSGTIAAATDIANPGGGEYDLTQNFAISPKQGTETRPAGILIPWVIKY